MVLLADLKVVKLLDWDGGEDGGKESHGKVGGGWRDLPWTRCNLVRPNGMGRFRGM